MSKEFLESIGAILTYKNLGTLGIGGQQIGANGEGNYCVIFLGDPIESEKAAHEYINQFKKESSRIKNVNIIPMIEIYYEMPIKIIDVKENNNFILEIVDHSTGEIKSSIEGDPDFLSTKIKDILKTLPDSYGVLIK